MKLNNEELAIQYYKDSIIEKINSINNRDILVYLNRFVYNLLLDGALDKVLNRKSEN